MLRMQTGLDKTPCIRLYQDLEYILPHDQSLGVGGTHGQDLLDTGGELPQLTRTLSLAVTTRHDIEICVDSPRDLSMMLCASGTRPPGRPITHREGVRVYRRPPYTTSVEAARSWGWQSHEGEH
jgi:hypothetical protein